MPHARQQMREAAGTVLSASVAGLWNHVFESRIKPSRRIEPFLMVFVDSETTEPSTIHPNPVIARDMVVGIRAYLVITDDEKIEDDMDAVASEIEQIFTFSALNTQLGSELKDLSLVSSDMSIETDDNERTAAVLALDWHARVFTVEGQPETLI